jgi:dTDP-4-amino-4,6-dideoxygalactose transaminase
MKTLQAAKELADPAKRIPFNNLELQWHEISADVLHDFRDVFATGAFCLGPQVEAFEREIADYLGVAHAIGVNSGTSALHLAIVAANVGRGDEVLVPAHTFIATIWGPLYTGATPILCDVDETTGTIDLADARRRLSPRTRAIVPVHLYGQPAQMDAIGDFAKRHGLAMIEDAAQAMGARWNRRAVGSFGLIGCFSFYPGKNLGAAGEGGLVVTSDATVAEHLRSLRNHGERERYVHSEIGFNYRMDGLQAVVLRHKLRRLDAWTERRRLLAARYRDGLASLPVDVPSVHHQDHVWHLFVVRTPRRDALHNHLQAADIESRLHYPVPMHHQPCLDHLRIDRTSFPNAERWAREALSLPLFYGMTDWQVDYVVDTVRQFFVDA